MNDYERQKQAQAGAQPPAGRTVDLTARYNRLEWIVAEDCGEPSRRPGMPCDEAEVVDALMRYYNG